MPSYTDKQIIEAVASSESFMGVLRYLGIRQTGGSHGHIKRRAYKMGLDTSHFTGQAHNKGKNSPKKKHWTEILILRNNGRRPCAMRLRRALIESGVEYQCIGCGIGPEWQGSKLTLEIDHINNNWLDDRRENLRFLCPNCHSQVSMPR